MHKKFFSYFFLALFFVAGTILTACGGTQAPEAIDWSSADTGIVYAWYTAITDTVPYKMSDPGI